MPSTSATGLPIPLDTDPLADIALAVRLLAAAIQSGVATVAVPAGTNPQTGSLVVVFPTAYAAAPNVVASPVSSVPANWSVGVSAITATQCTLYVSRLAGAATSLDVQWMSLP